MMINRMKDIVNLREAARRCRVIAESADGAPIADDYLKLAEEIDGKIVSLEAARSADRVLAVRTQRASAGDGRRYA